MGQMTEPTVRKHWETIVGQLPVQSIAWKDSSVKSPIMFQVAHSPTSDVSSVKSPIMFQVAHSPTSDVHCS